MPNLLRTRVNKLWKTNLKSITCRYRSVLTLCKWWINSKRKKEWGFPRYVFHLGLTALFLRHPVLTPLILAFPLHLLAFRFGVSSAFETATVHNIVFCHRLTASFLVTLYEYSELRLTCVFTVFVLSSRLSEAHIFPLSAFLFLWPDCDLLKRD